MRAAVVKAFSVGKQIATREELVAALEKRDAHRVLTLASDAITATADALLPALEKLVAQTRDAAGEASAKALEQQLLRAAWYDPDLGYDPHGRDGSKGKTRGKKDQARVERAKKGYKKSTAKKQRWAEENEVTLARMLGAERVGGQAPMDNVLKIGSKLHGFELKTMLDNGYDKITMHPPSRLRKEDWGRKNGAVLHTVVFDDRNLFGNKKQWSGHRIYYRRGVGAFRLAGLTPVRSTAHLKQLMAQKES